MSKKLVLSVMALLVFGCMAWSADKSWKGFISDSNCGTKHAAGGDEAAACIAKCVSGGAKYTLVSHGKSYNLDPQDKVSADLAGKAVKVMGTLSGDTITVSSVEAAPAKAKKAEKKAGT